MKVLIQWCPSYQKKSQIYAERTVANSYLIFFGIFPNKVQRILYIDKISLLHDTMTRYNLPQSDDVIEELPNNTLKSKNTLERESNKSTRSLMIAKDKKYRWHRYNSAA